MSSNSRKKVSDLRQQVNAYFQLSFKKRLINENEKGVADLEDNCPTKEIFVCQIANLANLIEDFDNETLRSLIKSETKGLKSIKLLEKLLDERNIDKRSIITSLQRLRRIRDTVYPVHHGTSKEFTELMRVKDFKPPYDWNTIWKDCLSTYRNSLAELIDALHDYSMKFKYEKIEKKQVQESESKNSIVYLNDYLYKYRLLVPLKDKSDELLIDYLTAALIAYDKNLKSIDYALRKYVVPLRDKFREHNEDPFFVKKRRYINNERLKSFGIMVSRDDIGIKDDKEFQKYFRYIWASFAAYQMGMSPDWIIKGYWGSSYLTNGRTYLNQK